MARTHWLLGLAGLMLALAIVPPLRAEYPKPSTYPVSWELTAQFSKPTRIVLQGPSDMVPKAYWYITYHVVNHTSVDRVPFFPSFEMMMDNGALIRSDTNVNPSVFESIKQNTRSKFMLNSTQVAGDLRQGDDQSRDGVAIWPEPNPRMGTFTVYIAGFWGEHSKLIKVGNSDVILKKTREVTYHLSSDERHPGEGDLAELSSQFIMR